MEYSERRDIENTEQIVNSPISFYTFKQNLKPRNQK